MRIDFPIVVYKINNVITCTVYCHLSRYTKLMVTKLQTQNLQGVDATMARSQLETRPSPPGYPGPAQGVEKNYRVFYRGDYSSDFTRKIVANFSYQKLCLTQYTECIHPIVLTRSGGTNPNFRCCYRRFGLATLIHQPFGMKETMLIIYKGWPKKNVH